MRLEGRRYIRYGGLDSSVEDYFFPGCAELVSLHWSGEWWHKYCPMLLWDTPQEFVCDAWIFEEFSPPIPVARLLGSCGFGNAAGCIKASASNDIQEVTVMGGCLMWNYATVCGGRIWLIFFVSVWSDIWKSCDMESAMMFSIPLMCCEYSDVSLLTSVHPSQWATESCDSAFTGSKDALFIQPSVLELYVNANMRDPCTICRMVI